MGKTDLIHVVHTMGSRSACVETITTFRRTIKGAQAARKHYLGIVSELDRQADMDHEAETEHFCTGTHNVYIVYNHITKA